ncbi:tumor necrosis factor b (TNF superfamily, member 2) isoform X2 [Gadus macrocephalus]|uniref:tumor necrosis factor b (TNF superfamily, member 2) isoform X2 n=1 Tax=Gadus macrocephalus TaxID=80720 RepID=UPI0028CB8882|nr:tumor necrosis factor b (TNF superfamily, member 2) isoform X2 [Gadus macrocephalus]
MEIGMGASGMGEGMVLVVQKRPALSWMWRVCVATFILALCVSGALVLTHYLMGQPGVSVSPEEHVVMEKESPQLSLKRLGSRSKPAVHLEGKPTGGQVEWLRDQGQAFLQGGFRVKENQILIPRSGLYFVYSQASFRIACEDDGEQARVTPLSHRVWRHSDSVGGPSTLMSAVRSACQRPTIRGEGWYNTIYLGAAFQLHKGDRLWTETNQPEQLEYEGGKTLTFFGVFSL